MHINTRCIASRHACLRCDAAGGADRRRPAAQRHQHAVAAPPPTIAPCAPLCAHARYHYTMPGPHSGPDCIILGGDTYHSTCVVMTGSISIILSSGIIQPYDERPE
jgi:hypothetical protein